jgi:hypothetical protein
VLGLQRTAGNRGVGTLLGEPSVQRDPNKDYRSTAGETLELAWTIRETKGGVKFSFKATVSRQGGKVLESPTADTAAGDLSYSLGENKATLERASGKFGRKVSSALAQANWVPGKVPGFENLHFRLSGKGPEAKFDLSKGEVGLDVLKIQGAVEGDMSGILDYAGLAHWKDRVKIKGAFQVEKGISVADLARLKAALVYVDEAKKAAAQAEKYAADFAEHRAKLNALDAERKKLERQLARRKASLARATRQWESVQGKGRGRKPARDFAARQKKLAEEAVQKAEKAMLHNTNLRRVEGYYIGKASKGLAAAGKRLSEAGHKLDKAVAKVTDKLAKPVKQALEKVTAKIMKKLAGTLLAKGLKYLIPGLNLVSTLWDIGSLLYDFFNSKDADGVPGGGGDGDDTGASGGGGDGSAGTGGGSGSGAGADAGSSSSDTAGSGPKHDPGGSGTGQTTGTGGTSSGGAGGQPTKEQLIPLAKELLEAFHGDPLTLDDAAVAMLNQGVPADLKPDEKVKLLERLRAAAGGSADPYELVTEIQAQLAEIRAGEDTVEFGDEPPQPASQLDAAKIEPPKTLLPFTRRDALSTISYDKGTQKFVIRPAYANFQGQSLPPHPDGLTVKLTAFDVDTTQPSGAKGQVMVKLTFGVEVVSLPAGADANYPYKVGESKQEKMSFLYDPKAKDEAAWGEMDFSHVAQLRGLLSRSNGSWTLTGAGQLVHFAAATVRVDKLLETKVVTAADGSKVTKFAVLVTPTEILGSRAGYTSGQGWVDFVKNKPVPITFELADGPSAATKP